MKARTLREGFLRQTGGCPQFADPLPDRRKHSCMHNPISWAAQHVVYTTCCAYDSAFMPVGAGVSCPVCGGLGAIRDRRLRAYQCGLCDGTGAVGDTVLGPIEDLRDHVMRVVDAIQGGRDEDAAIEAQIVFRLAGRIVR